MMRFPPPGFIPTASAVPGIELYRPAPADDKLAPVVNFRCPQCDGATAYSAADGGITCAYCGYHEAPQHPTVGRSADQFEFTVETMTQATHGWGIERTELLCRTCDAHLTLEAGHLTTTCPFCGSNQVVHHKARQDVLRPRFLVPFAVDSDRCHAVTRAWLGNSRLVPATLQRLAALGDFNPVFLPFWTFDARAAAAWRAEVGHTRTYTDREGKTRTETVWKWENGSVTTTFDDLTVRGSDDVDVDLLHQIRDFRLDGLVPYDPAYLAGMHAQAYEIGLADAWASARRIMRERVRRQCVDQASSSNMRNFSMSLDFADESWRYILLPIYISTYFFENKPYHIVVNGQSGTIAGQRPADWRKVALWTAVPLLLALLLALVNSAVGDDGLAFLAFVLFAAGVIAGAVLAIQATRLQNG